MGALIGMGACAYVWFGDGEFFQTYGIYGVAALYGKNTKVLELHKTLVRSFNLVCAFFFFFHVKVLVAPLC